MRKLTLMTMLLLLASLKVFAQETKPWTEWSRVEAEKILNDSPWGQTQVSKQTLNSSSSASSSRSTSTVATGSMGPAGTIGSANENDGTVMKSVLMGGAPRLPATTTSSTSVSYTYRIRFLSAKPIRAAFAAMLLNKRADSNSADRQQAAESLKIQLQKFLEAGSGDYIVVSVESLQMPDDLSPQFKENTYLQRGDGKRVLLLNYKAAGSDGLGAQFLFPRSLEGHPFLTLDSGEVRFCSEFGPVKLNKRFKVSDMVYQGKLEY
jgi:hypothetical protein